MAKNGKCWIKSSHKMTWKLREMKLFIKLCGLRQPALFFLFCFLTCKVGLLWGLNQIIRIKHYVSDTDHLINRN